VLTVQKIVFLATSSLTISDPERTLFVELSREWEWEGGEGGDCQSMILLALGSGCLQPYSSRANSHDDDVFGGLVLSNFATVILFVNHEEDTA